MFAYNIPFIVTIKKCSMQYFWQNFMEVLYSVRLPVLRKYYHFFQTTLPLVLCPLILTQEPLLNGICYQNIEGPIIMKWWKSLRTQRNWLLLKKQMMRFLQSQKTKWYGDFKESRLENPVSLPRLAEKQRWLTEKKNLHSFIHTLFFRVR